jgi:hypothetical protein
MSNIAPDGRILTPADNDLLQDMTAEALLDRDWESVYRLNRYRFAPLPTSDTETPPAWRTTLEERFRRTGTFTT